MLSLPLVVIILMIALNEQISNFKRQIEKMKIADYTPLFKQPKVEEATIQEVIVENNLLAESIKMMSSVFLNYCWLNERVYGKISEHQLNLHDQQSRLSNLNHKLDSRLEDSLKNFKLMYEDSLLQNKKNKEIVEVGLKSICEEIQTKVNDTQLTEKIKEILLKYDQGDLIQTELTGSIAGSSVFVSTIQPQLHYAQSLPAPQKGERRVGKVGYDDHYRLKDELEHHLAKMRKQIHDLEHEHSHNKEKYSKLGVIVDKHEEEIKHNKSEFTKAHLDSKYSISFLSEQLERTNAKLDQRLSEQEWKRRLNLFEMRVVDPLRLHFNEGFIQQRGDIKKIKEETYYKTNLLECSLSQFGKELQQFKAKVAKDVEDIAFIELRFTEIQQRFEHQSQQFHRKSEDFIQQSKKSGKQFEKNLKKELAQLKNTIYKLSSTVQQKAFKVISKKIQSSFQSFETDLMENREMVKSLTAGVTLANEQINNIKELVSKKANFSDVVHYIETKADKHDIKELKNKINQNSQSRHMLPRQLSDTLNTQNESILVQSPLKYRPVIKTPRTQFISYPATQRGGSRSKQKSTRNTHIDLQGTARKLLIRDTKKKIMKSYSTLITDLRN